MEQLEGSVSTGVAMKPRRGRKKKTPRSRSKSSIPSVQSQSAGSISERSQSEWLNDIVPERSCFGCSVGWLKEHKYEIAAGIVIVGALVWFSTRKAASSRK